MHSTCHIRHCSGTIWSCATAIAWGQGYAATCKQYYVINIVLLLQLKKKNNNFWDPRIETENSLRFGKINSSKL